MLLSSVLQPSHGHLLSIISPSGGSACSPDCAVKATGQLSKITKKEEDVRVQNSVSQPVVHDLSAG